MQAADGRSIKDPAVSRVFVLPKRINAIDKNNQEISPHFPQIVL